MAKFLLYKERTLQEICVSRFTDFTVLKYNLSIEQHFYIIHYGLL